MTKRSILLLGKIPPPYMGPSIATEIILKSSLKEEFEIIHLDTRLNKNLNEMGRVRISKVFRIIKQYIQCIGILIFRRPGLMLVPISQSIAGYKKDSVFIRFGRWVKVPTVIHLRGSNFLNFYKSAPVKLQKKIQFDFQYVAGGIVLGEKLRYIFQPFLPNKKIFVVPNGINLKYSSLRIQSSKEFKLVYLGNLQRSKGILDVIDAYIKLNCAQDTQLNIIGKWRDEITRQEIKYMLSSSGFNPLATRSDQYINTVSHKHIVFHSVLHGQSKFNILATCDLMLFTPREPEGHPWVIIEAMAAGLPIISTDQGAITESVIEGQNGYIVANEDSKAIAGKVKHLINHPQLRKQMGQRSRQIYEEKFTEEKMVQNLRNVFNKVLLAD